MLGAEWSTASQPQRSEMQESTWKNHFMWSKEQETQAEVWYQIAENRKVATCSSYL